MKRALAATLGASLLACAGATTHLAESPDYGGPQIASIGVADSGVLADAIRVELVSRGFTVPEVADSADAVLHVSGSGDYQGLPQSAAIRLVSQSDGQMIAAGTWNNGWGGESGSIADRFMRQGAPDAARQIVDAICRKIAPERVSPKKDKLHNR